MFKETYNQTQYLPAKSSCSRFRLLKAICWWTEWLIVDSIMFQTKATALFFHIWCKQVSPTQHFHCSMHMPFLEAKDLRIQFLQLKHPASSRT